MNTCLNTWPRSASESEEEYLKEKDKFKRSFYNEIIDRGEPVPRETPSPFAANPFLVNDNKRHWSPFYGKKRERRRKKKRNKRKNRERNSQWTHHGTNRTVPLVPCSLNRPLVRHLTLVFFCDNIFTLDGIWNCISLSFFNLI